MSTQRAGRRNSPGWTRSRKRSSSGWTSCTGTPPRPGATPWAMTGAGPGSSMCCWRCEGKARRIQPARPTSPMRSAWPAARCPPGESSLLAALTADEKQVLAGLLRKLVLALEPAHVPHTRS